MSREIMQQALDVLLNEYSSGAKTNPSPYETIAALKAELAKPEQPDLRKAAEMALEALKWSWSDEIKRADKEVKAIAALRQALAQPEYPLDKKADNARELGLDYEPEQEPVAWMRNDGTLLFADGNVFAVGQAFYTAPPRKEQDESYGYAKRLAESIWKDHCKEISPHWRPFPTTLGVLTQIDNMIAGIERQRKEWQGLDDEDWANIPDFQKEGCELDAAIADWIEKRLKGKNT